MQANIRISFFTGQSNRLCINDHRRSRYNTGRQGGSKGRTLFFRSMFVLYLAKRLSNVAPGGNIKQMFTEIKRRENMNVQEYDIMNKLAVEKYASQRALAEQTGYSLGKVNTSLKSLKGLGYLDEDMGLTEKAKKEFDSKRPQNAVILAAGFGMRMIPINMEVPKGIIEVRGEPLIERLIKQLHEAGIREIDIVVGFMKEQYEYLIDKYQVELVYNGEYATKNNLFSLKKVIHKIGNTYILPCDIWCSENPFSENELYSWYMVAEDEIKESTLRVNRKRELAAVAEADMGNRIIGISYILKEDARRLKEKVQSLCEEEHGMERFWDDALLDGDKMYVMPKVVPALFACEINTLEELRELDSNSGQLKADVIKVIEEQFQCGNSEITNIKAIKKGMTNRSFEFTCRGKRYIARIPGEGTESMIDRRQEYEVYQCLKGKGITDPVCYISRETGYKITEFVEGSRVCDPDSPEDVKRAMRYLRSFHEQSLSVGHAFDLFGQIEHYESLWRGEKSVYRDYAETKKKVYELKKYVDAQPRTIALAHIDAVPDNFLFTDERTYLIDWEYAGMQDIHVDIAMFAIYAMYGRQKVEDLIDAYFEDQCPDRVRIKIYCYIAICGFLWSNWCEYKRICGVEFGEYSLRQYRYAKDYYRIVKNAESIALTDR